MTRRRNFKLRRVECPECGRGQLIKYRAVPHVPRCGNCNAPGQQLDPDDI